MEIGKVCNRIDDDQNSRRLAWLRIGLFISKVGQGLYTVCIAWSAFSLGENISSVGIVLIWWSIVTLVFGPFLGVVSDKFDQRFLHLFARIFETLLFISVATLLEAGFGSIKILILTACLASIVALIVNPCLHVFIKQATDLKFAVKQSISAMAFMQAGLVAGTGVGGLLLAHWGIVGGFLACSGASLLSLGFVRLSKPEAQQIRISSASFIREFAEGILIIVRSRQIRGPIIGLTLSSAVGQITISILPAFVAISMKGEAGTYGLVDSVYSLGSMAASILFFLTLNKREYPYLASVSLTAAAFLLIAISIIDKINFALPMFLILGTVCSICRISYDGAIQAATSPGAVGRVRNNAQSIVGLVGIFIYLIPSTVQCNDPASFYLLYGVALILLSLYCLWLSYKMPTHNA